MKQTKDKPFEKSLKGEEMKLTKDNTFLTVKEQELISKVAEWEDEFGISKLKLELNKYEKNYKIDPMDMGWLINLIEYSINKSELKGYQQVKQEMLKRIDKLLIIFRRRYEKDVNDKIYTLLIISELEELKSSLKKKK